MAKGPVYTCRECGAAAPKWAGRCEACGAWNSLVEETPLSAAPGRVMKGGKGRRIVLSDLAGDEAPPPRTASGMAELDRVLGGGLVPASAVLVGGDPGIGKSTLLLQAAARFASAGLSVIYVTGEEATAQVEGFLQRCVFDDTVSLEQMLAHAETGRYLAACRRDGAWRFPQKVRLLFVHAR